MIAYQLEELEKCKNDIVYFVENYIHIFNKVISSKVKLTNEQKRILRRAKRHQKYLLKSCRQFGKTTLLTLLALHTLMFDHVETIVVATNKLGCADQIALNVKHYIDFLPHWMAESVVRQDKHTYICGDSMLCFTSSSPSRMKGRKPTTLLVDELAFFDPEFFMNVYPVVAQLNVKFTVFSTPAEKNDVVEELYNAAHQGLNDFVTDIVTWKEAELWSEEAIESFKNNLGEKSFEAEFNCQV